MSSLICVNILNVGFFLAFSHFISIVNGQETDNSEILLEVRARRKTVFNFFISYLFLLFESFTICMYYFYSDDNNEEEEKEEKNSLDKHPDL